MGALFDSITEQLAQGGRVELRGFGAFSAPARRPVGRNPRTGDPVSVDAKRVPYFKPGKEMRERLNLGGVTASSRAGSVAADGDPDCGHGGTVDAGDLKSSPRTGVWVQLPPSAPSANY